MKQAGEGAMAWDWEREEVEAEYQRLQRELDPQLLMLLGIRLFGPFLNRIPRDFDRAMQEKEAAFRIIDHLVQFNLNNERGIRAVWVAIAGLVGGIWAHELGHEGTEAGPRLQKLVFEQLFRQAPWRSPEEP